VDKVVCVTVGDPEQVQKWAAENGFDKDTVRRGRGAGPRRRRRRARCAHGASRCWGAERGSQLAAASTRPFPHAPPYRLTRPSRRCACWPTRTSASCGCWGWSWGRRGRGASGLRASSTMASCCASRWSPPRATSSSPTCRACWGSSKRCAGGGGGRARAGAAGARTGAAVGGWGLARAAAEWGPGPGAVAHRPAAAGASGGKRRMRPHRAPLLSAAAALARSSLAPTDRTALAGSFLLRLRGTPTTAAPPLSLTVLPHVTLLPTTLCFCHALGAELAPCAHAARVLAAARERAGAQAPHGPGRGTRSPAPARPPAPPLVRGRGRSRPPLRPCVPRGPQAGRSIGRLAPAPAASPPPAPGLPAAAAALNPAFDVVPSPYPFRSPPRSSRFPPVLPRSWVAAPACGWEGARRHGNPGRSSRPQLGGVHRGDGSEREQA
jgi:hypothetical protein